MANNFDGRKRMLGIIVPGKPALPKMTLKGLNQHHQHSSDTATTGTTETHGSWKKSSSRIAEGRMFGGLGKFNMPGTSINRRNGK